MNRREVLSGMGVAGAAAIAARAALGQTDKKPAKQPAATPATGHEHHHMGGSKYQALIESTHACMATGDVCINHCLQSLGTGDKTLAECAKSVEAMLPLVTATGKLA